MEINHENAMRLWTKRYGKGVQEARDREGRQMLKTAFGDEGSEYGWNLHHKEPKSGEGTNAKRNFEPIHFLTHEELHGRNKRRGA
jgi:hypothetical protein